MNLSWNTRYRIRSYLQSALWIVPLLAVFIERPFGIFIHWLDFKLAWEGVGLGVEGARALSNAVVTFSLSFIVFTFGSLLVAIQVASGQYTPRIIATTLLRDNVIRFTVGLFVFTLLFAVKALNRIETSVPELVVIITGVLGMTCLLAFLFLIDYAARLLRPVSLVKLVGDAGLAVMDSVYPEKLADAPHAEQALDQNPGTLKRRILHRGTSSIVLAVNVQQVVAEAARLNGVIEFAPHVGDFVGVDEPLFLLHSGAEHADENKLRRTVIFGSERTLEQDPLFALRILVDIAIKALSAAINDPTTAVLAMDQIQRVLRRAGTRNLRTDQISDRAGNLRMILKTPDWDDFVHLACTEIRHCGVSNMQIVRRLRAMLLNLREALPPPRHAALMLQLDLLDRMMEKVYQLPEDLALAKLPDSQGIGASNHAGNADAKVARSLLHHGEPDATPSAQHHDETGSSRPSINHQPS